MTVLARLLDLALLPAAEVPHGARAYARLSLFDWMVCGRAGRHEPLAGILRAMASEEGGTALASMIGGGLVPARAAALVNGATSHALDYDDTHFGHIGHPSVAIYPAALAVGEAENAAASAVVDAFLIGAEASVRLGMVLGAAHYKRGFHQTATAGAFGATVAAGRLYGLDRNRMRAALNLCATRASGLKSQFGTMGKPYNAGIAASNGVECARLAWAGFTAPDDAITGPQGFVPTHSDAPLTDWPDQQRFVFEDVKYKLHACCHGTHAMIEALAALQQAHGLRSNQVGLIRLRTHPGWLSVCDIKVPRTGLEVKFSYAWLAGMVFSGKATSADKSYSEALATDAGLMAFADRITVSGGAGLTQMQAAGDIVLDDGTVLPFAHDLAAALPLTVQESALRRKATALIGAEAQTLWQAIDAFDGLSARDLGHLLRAT